MEKWYAFFIGAGIASIFLFIFRKNLKRRRNIMIKSVKTILSKGNKKYE